MIFTKLADVIYLCMFDRLLHTPLHFRTQLRGIFRNFNTIEVFNWSRWYDHHLISLKFYMSRYLSVIVGISKVRQEISYWYYRKATYKKFIYRFAADWPFCALFVLNDCICWHQNSQIYLLVGLLIIFSFLKLFSNHIMLKLFDHNFVSWCHLSLLLKSI